MTKKGVEGEGSYEATREYNRRTEEYLKSADVTGDARKASPRNEAEKREMERAEAEGKRRARNGSPAEASNEGEASAMDSDDA